MHFPGITRARYAHFLALDSQDHWQDFGVTYGEQLHLSALETAARAAAFRHRAAELPPFMVTERYAYGPDVRSALTMVEGDLRRGLLWGTFTPVDVEFYAPERCATRVLTLADIDALMPAAFEDECVKALDFLGMERAKLWRAAGFWRVEESDGFMNDGTWEARNTAFASHYDAADCFRTIVARRNLTLGKAPQ